MKMVNGTSWLPPANFEGYLIASRVNAKFRFWHKHQYHQSHALKMKSDLSQHIHFMIFILSLCHLDCQAARTSVPSYLHRPTRHHPQRLSIASVLACKFFLLTPLLMTVTDVFR
jgi:hypothetical protein